MFFYGSRADELHLTILWVTQWVAHAATHTKVMGLIAQGQIDWYNECL